MIIYGSRHKVAAQETYPGKCVHCDQIATVQFVVIQRYAHVFWIPFFPIGKKGASVCSHCKQALNEKQFNDDYHHFYNQVKLNRRPPVYMYSGLILIGLLVISAVISSNKHQAELRKRLAHPQVGDIYSIKEGYDRYTLYKVAHTSKDSVYLLFHMMEINKERGLDKLRSIDVYGNEQQAYPLGEIEAMYNEGKLVNIN